ncbi:MAG: hypothetical protein KME12_09180 [Trichocoleus desertorum ATA4-8-CV12]|jgi:hypothetical protein|nr:hypothetical protein [Trichocoleus desertorum ATA4-8-CV12]
MYKEREFIILLVSGQPADYNLETEAWLADHEVEYDALWMRSTEDSRPDFIVKKEIYKECIQGQYNVFFVLDDCARRSRPSSKDVEKRRINLFASCGRQFLIYSKSRFTQ